MGVEKLLQKALALSTSANKRRLFLLFILTRYIYIIDVILKKTLQSILKKNVFVSETIEIVLTNVLFLGYTLDDYQTLNCELYSNAVIG